jgi:hypothetical protein
MRPCANGWVFVVGLKSGGNRFIDRPAVIYTEEPWHEGTALNSAGLSGKGISDGRRRALKDPETRPSTAEIRLGYASNKQANLQYLGHRTDPKISYVCIFQYFIIFSCPQILTQIQCHHRFPPGYTNSTGSVPALIPAYLLTRSSADLNQWAPGQGLTKAARQSSQAGCPKTRTPSANPSIRQDPISYDRAGNSEIAADLAYWNTSAIAHR